LTDGETEGFSKGGDGDDRARLFKQCYGAIGTGSQKPGLLVTFALPGNADPEALPPFSQARQSKSDIGFLSPRAWEPVIENDRGLLYSDFYMELR